MALTIQSLKAKVFSRQSRRRALLSVVLVMNLRTFSYFPGGRQLEELWFVLCLVGFVLLYPLIKMKVDWTFTPLELYLLLIIPVLLGLPAIDANQVFGQPMLYGLLGQRSVTLTMTWLVLMGIWRLRWISSADIETALIFLTWAVFVIFTFMRLFLNPENFASAPPGFVLGLHEPNPTFAVPGVVMQFGVIYYALRGLREKRSKFYLFAALLFVSTVGQSGRFLSVSFALTIAYFLIRWRPINQILSAISKFILLAAAVTIVMLLVAPNELSTRFTRFADAYKVATGGGEGQDTSANARIVETEIALPYIKAHPYFGNGALSSQWNGGNAGSISTYFFQDDIGLLGVLFSYGIVGLLLLACQYLFAIRAAYRNSYRVYDALLDGAKGFIVFSFINSFTTGLFVFSFQTSAFFIVLFTLVAGDLHEKRLHLTGDPNRVQTGPLLLNKSAALP